MVYIVRNRYATYKKFNLDIWGLVRTLVNLHPQPFGFPFRRPWKLPYRSAHKEMYEKDKTTKENIKLEKSWLWYYKATKAQKRILSKWRFPLILTKGTKKKTRLLLFFYKLWEARRKRRMVAKRRYIYRIDIKPTPYFRRRVRSVYLKVHLLRTYYMIYNYRQLKKFFRNAHKRMGFYDHNLALLLECRSMCFLYRTGFLPSMFAAIAYIKASCVTVNNVLIRSVHKRIYPGEFVSFTRKAKLLLASSFLKRVKKRRMLFGKAPYLFISYGLFMAYFKKLPSMRQLVFPIRFDLHAVVNYFASRK
jgi:small subunit ribosomal protein S4